MKYLKTFSIFESESKSIGKEKSIEDSIKHLKSVPKEYKEVSYGLLKQYTRAKNGRISGLNLHNDLKRKIDEGGYPSGFDMGIDKDGYYIHTHRARSKSYPKPDGITVKEIKFIDSTG